MVDRKLHSINFEPIVQPDEYLKFFPESQLGKEFVGVKVIMVYSLPDLRLDLCDSAHLNTSLLITESAEDELDDLDLDAHELGQYRIVPISDFKITHLAMPKARPMYYNKNSKFSIQTILDTPESNPAVERLQMNEIFKWEDTDLYYKAQANTATLTAANLAVFGYRFICEPVKMIPVGVRPLTIPVAGYGGLSK